MDAAILLAAFLVAASFQYPDTGVVEVAISHANLMVFSVAVFLVSFTALGIYRTVSYSPLKHHFLSASKAYIYSVAVILSTLFLSGNLFYPRTFLIILFILLPNIYTFVWLGVRRSLIFFQKFGFGRWNTLVIGPGK
ncbi:MAG: hypothetical protein HY961_01445, partial [Ignavibacteriae bacterium]|nr:hypothetical protein [Ignavibacteriota bacterium]